MNKIIENLDEWPEMEALRVYKWYVGCCKCRKETPHVSYYVVISGNLCVIGDLIELDNLLKKEYPFVNNIFSKTRGERIIANTCVHCGALQENFFILDEIIHYVSENDVDKKILNIVTMKEIEAQIIVENKKALFLKLTSGKKKWFGKSILHTLYVPEKDFQQRFLIAKWVLEKNKIY